MFSAKLPVQRLSLIAREHYFFALFRCLQASLLALWIFSPFAPYYSELNSILSLKILSVGLVFLACVLVVLEKRHFSKNRLLLSITIDILVFGYLAWVLPVSFYIVALLLIVNLASAGLLLPNLQSTLLTFSAVVVLMVHYLRNAINGVPQEDIAQPLMFTMIYACIVLFCQMLAKKDQQSQDLAEARGEQLLEMAQMNELIIKRMRTGVILLNKNHQIILSNESANGLNKKVLQPNQSLFEFAPELDKRLWQWRYNPDTKPSALCLYDNGPEVIPRFVALTKQDVFYLIFLEDSRVFSGRADELQLANLGRLSASIAHEIRNPLAAIRYAQQLLSESKQIAPEDLRLLNIIGAQSLRMNGIIDNVLDLAKRDSAHPETIELNDFLDQFLQEFLFTNPNERSKIRLQHNQDSCIGLFDPLHLYQIISALLNNALRYGYLPYKAPEIVISLQRVAEQFIIEVTDKGPGILPTNIKNLFTPFYTSSEHGIGLGLYIAKQLAEANQAQLRYEENTRGGCKFSLVLSAGKLLAK